MINRASEGTCRQCGRRILWVRMKSGKNMPVDMALHNYKKDSTGKEKIVTPDGEVVTGRILVGERGDGAGYISHFASCKKYRRWSMTHELKTYPKYFQETIEGNKPFEIRKNDRNFQVGDVLILKEWDNIKYSGREIGAVVRYVLRDFIGLQEGYVALGLQILS